MFKNKLPISSLISVVVISIGAFFTLMSVSYYERQGFYEKNDNFILLIIGLSLFITGISILLRKTWARTTLTISILGLMSFLVYSFIFGENYNTANFLEQAALLSLAIGLPLSFIFLLYNEKVSIEFGDKHVDEEFEDVLDHFE
jgi:predicted MFS family arabinose efflux permease